MNLKSIISELEELQKYHKSNFEDFEKLFLKSLPQSTGNGIGADDMLDILNQIKVELSKRINRYSFIINELKQKRFPIDEKAKMNSKRLLIKGLLESFINEYSGSKNKIETAFPDLDLYEIENYIRDFKGFIIQILEEINITIEGFLNEYFSKDEVYYYFSFDVPGEVQLNKYLSYNMERCEFILNQDRTKNYPIHGYNDKIKLMKLLIDGALNSPGIFLDKKDLIKELGLKYSGSYPNGRDEETQLDQLKDKLMQLIRKKYTFHNNEEKFIEIKRGYRLNLI